MEPARTPEAFVEELKALVAKNVAGNVELMARLNALVQRAAESARDRPPVDASELLARFLDFNLQSYALRSQHRLALFNELLSVAERTLVRDRPAASPAGAAPSPAPAARGRIDVRREGRPGQRVSWSFLVENQYERPVDVTFEADPLVPDEGAPVPAAAVAFEPSTLTVPGRADAVGTAAVQVGPDFVVGRTYRSTVRVLWFEGREIGIVLDVLPPDDAPAPQRKGARRTGARTGEPARSARGSGRQPTPVSRTRPPRRRRVTSAPGPDS